MFDLSGNRVDHKGQSFVSIQAMEEQGRTVDAPAPEAEVDTDVRLEMIQVLALFVAQFMALPRTTRDVVCFRFLDLCGERYTFGDIGVLAGISAQAAEQRMNEAIKISPAIRKMFAGKVAKRLTRGRSNETRKE